MQNALLNELYDAYNSMNTRALTVLLHSLNPVIS